jgi:hypothetical protein
MSLLSVGIPNSTGEKTDSPSLHLSDRIILHQVHPAKLAVDWGTGLAAAFLLWDHLLPAALIIGLLPSILISLYLILRTDLSRYRDTPLGRYFLSPRTRPSDPVRLCGLVVMWTGAWFNNLLALVAGLLVILAAWGKGLRVRKPGPPPPRRQS